VVVEASRVHVLTRQGEPLLVHEAKAYGLLRGVVSAPAAHRIILVDEGASRLHLLSTRCATAPTALVLGDLARVVSGGKRAKSLHALARFEVARHVERRRSEASSSTHQETLLRQYKSDDSDDSDGGDESDGGDDSDDGDESASDSGSGDESESDDAASDNEFAALEPDDGDGSDASDQSDADERDYGDSSEEAEESGSGC